MEWTSKIELKKLKLAKRKFAKIDNLPKKKKAKNKKPELNYYVYLRSKIWKRKRLKTLVKANYLCESCKKNKATQIHHKTYKRIFNEKQNDLIALCNVCHKMEHNLLSDEQIEIEVLELLKNEGYAY